MKCVRYDEAFQLELVKLVRGGAPSKRTARGSKRGKKEPEEVPKAEHIIGKENGLEQPESITTRRKSVGGNVAAHKAPGRKKTRSLR